MHGAKLFSVAAIVALATVGPAFAYQPATSSPSLSYLTGEAEIPSSDVAKEGTQVAWAMIKWGTTGWKLHRGDNGKPFANCENRANCSMTIKKEDFQGVGIDCASAQGCVIIGKK